MTDPRRSLQLNQATEILHFPIWVLMFLNLLLLVIIIGATRREISKNTNKIDALILRNRLKIKVMVLLLSLLVSAPWIFTLCIKYLIIDFQPFNAVFCLYSILQVIFCLYFIYILYLTRYCFNQ